MGLQAVANICKQISVAILAKKKRNRLQKCITTKIGNIIEGIHLVNGRTYQPERG